MQSQYFDFTIDNGLVACQNIETAKNNSEILYLHEAQRLGATAVFFRRFFKEDSKTPYTSEPSVCIFEIEDSFFNSDEHISLHAKLWSSGKNEIYVLNGRTRIDIINARKPAEIINGHELTIESLVLQSFIVREEYNFEKFSAYLFESGTFWEQHDFRDKVDESMTPYVYLLNYLMSVRKNLQKNKTVRLEARTIDKLLVVCILIKFLEEIKDDNGKHTLKQIYKKLKTNDLAEAVQDGKFIELLGELTNEFNGKIFDKFSSQEITAIRKNDLSVVAKFLQADVDFLTHQRFLWKQYDFKYLPVEVISAIYENFIQEEAKRSTGILEKGVVYTPIHLVNFLIDEMMPLQRSELFLNESFRVLDPACGSGIFLVAAFKRLLQWWAINNSKEGIIKYPSCKKAQKLLEENIFGVDVKETATLVSVFSLTIALLDKLSPQEIWNNLKFEDLSLKNIRCENFFKWALTAKNDNENFDLVIGNPPFNPENGKKKLDVLVTNVIEKLDFKHKKIPINDFALHFFEASMLLSSRTCLIIPSNILLYSKSSQKYRTQIFTDYNIEKIFDYTHLRRDLFSSADTPVIAVVADNIPSKKLKVEHTVVKRTIISEKKVRFEIDYYDRHYVPWDWVVDETKQFVWKCNLLGGGRLFQLIYRLSLFDSLKNYISPNLTSKRWKFNIGYIIGKETQNYTADFITNQDCICSIDENGNITTTKETSKIFDEIRDAALFTPPYIIFKSVFNGKKLPVYFVQSHKRKYLVFKRNFIGLSAPNYDKELLSAIYERIKKHSGILSLWIIANSASAMVKTETALNKEDIENLPFPADEKYLKLSRFESVLKNDVLNYYIHLGKSIGKRGTGQIFYTPTDEKTLMQFGIIFCETLNQIYSTESKSWQCGTVIRNDVLTIYQFGYGKNNGLTFSVSNKKNQFLNILSIKEIENNSAAYKRIIRIYKHVNGYDCLFLIKPNITRYWLGSIALRDADDTFMELKMGGF